MGSMTRAPGPVGAPRPSPPAPAGGGLLEFASCAEGWMLSLGPSGSEFWSSGIVALYYMFPRRVRRPVFRRAGYLRPQRFEDRLPGADAGLPRKRAMRSFSQSSQRLAQG